jgi:hypothetical protein
MAYTIYGNIYTTFGLGVRHTGHPGRPATPGFSVSVLGVLTVSELQGADEHWDSNKRMAGYMSVKSTTMAC